MVTRNSAEDCSSGRAKTPWLQSLFEQRETRQTIVLANQAGDGLRTLLRRVNTRKNNRLLQRQGEDALTGDGLRTLNLLFFP